MEALPWSGESEVKELVDGNLLHHSVDLESYSKSKSESSNGKRKVESFSGLFCVMRKRIRRHKYVDDMCPDLEDNAENILEDEDVDECWRCGSDSDIELSECSEFDVISEQVLEDFGLMEESSTGLKFLSIEDEGALVSKLSSETHDSFLLLSPDEANGEIGVIRSKDDVVSSTGPHMCLGHSSDISLIKEDQEIQCSSDMFMNDGDKSSEVEVRKGDVVNMQMQASLEQICSDDEVRLWNNDDYPVSICSVPPAGQSSILLETGSLHQNVRCIKESNVHGDRRQWNKDDDPIPMTIFPPAGDESRILLESCPLHQNVRCIEENNVHGDHIVCEATPIRLPKTFKGPSKSLSVCDSLSASRNLPLVEDSSRACGSLNEQLHVNVSSSEDREAELAQTPSALYQEEVDGEDEICFSEVDAMIRKLNLLPEDSVTCLDMSQHPRHTLLGLEHCTKASVRRAIMFQGAIAVLLCRDSKHYIRKHEVIIGRSSHGLKVDIDLGKDGYGSKISRRQALVKLENTGSFSLKNLGKRYILVNGEKLNTGQIGSLKSCSSINLKGIVFEFKINKETVRQFLKNNTQKADDAKFKWCE